MDTINLLDTNTREKLCRLGSIIEDSKYRYALIGATAFFIHQVNLTRTTRDIDFTILITGDWDDFEDLKRSFAKESFQSTGIPHRMKSGDGFIIDLLPVGPRFIKDKAIWWPDGMVMNANGLEEAIEHAIEINISKQAGKLPGQKIDLFLWCCQTFFRLRDCQLKRNMVYLYN
jgi:predicted nucleotidyltransferase